MRNDKKDERQILQEQVKDGLRDLRVLQDKQTAAYTRLVLDGNLLGSKIKKLNNSLCNYLHLRVIDLSNNQIENVEFLALLPSLLHLNLSGNLISNLGTFKKENEDPEAGSRWPSLRYLNLQGNKVNEVNVL